MTSTYPELAGGPRNALLLAARLLLAFIFVHEGVFLIFNFDSAASATSKLGVPNVVFVATIVLQLFAGMAIALGIFTRLGAIALAIFCFLTAFMFHTHFGVRDELLHFEKDLAIAGGMFVLMVRGAGRYSMDAYAGQKALSGDVWRWLIRAFESAGNVRDGSTLSKQ
jgi:putative oxidoreductase